MLNNYRCSLCARRLCAVLVGQALVRQASPAVHDALRESVRDLAEAKRAAGFASGPTTSVPAAGSGGGAAAEMARTASTLSRATGISKASIAELVKIIPSFTVADLRTLHKKFYEHVTAADGYLQQQTFSAVRPDTAASHAAGWCRRSRSR